MYSLLVNDCFISLVLRWHLDMIVVELDELELVRHCAEVIWFEAEACSN